jgi:hypothetical protein
MGTGPLVFGQLPLLSKKKAASFVPVSQSVSRN